MDDLDLGQTVRGFAAGQKLFGRYTLKAVLGRGGMGIVWRAWDEQLERDVALKFLPELVIHDRAVLDDLKRETRRSLELTHHNIVRIHDFAQDAQSACISMEYVDGATLSSLRVDRPNKVFEPAELLPLVEQACDALNYAHNRAKIVHRDLKPANLMLNAKGELKVTDFGISRSLTDSISMMTMGGRGTSGTLPYMSPQQLDGERTSHLDDIYSLGATIYDLLTSKPPFHSGNVDRQIHDKVPPPVADRREELSVVSRELIPPHWEQAIAACLAKDPAQRPQSAGDVARRLGLHAPYTAPPPAQHTRAPTATATTATLSRRKWPLFAAGAGLLLAIAAFAGWWFAVEQPRRHAVTQRPAAAQPVAPATETARPAEEKNGAAGEVLPTPAGAQPATATAATKGAIENTEGGSQARAEVRLRMPVKPRLERTYYESLKEYSSYSIEAASWGFLNGNGDVVINPQWDDTGSFWEGLAPVQRRSKWGHIDKEGRVVVEPQFDELTIFSEGLAPVKRGSKYGYINKEGRVVIEAKWDDADPFYEGLASVERSDKQGYIDKTGRIVIEPRWRLAFNFSEGLAMVNQGDKYGFIDKKGNVVIQLNWEDASGFTEGLAAVTRGSKAGFIDKKGDVVIEPAWDEVSPFREGLAPVKRGSKWGYIDREGRVVIEPQWDEARSFHKGLAEVKRGSKSGYIDRDGRLRIEPEWDAVSYQSDSAGGIYFQLARLLSGHSANGPAEVRWVDPSGKVIWRTP